MLTKTDLSQIRAVVKEEIKDTVKQSGLTLTLTLALKPIKKDLKKIRKDLEFAVGTLDRERWQLEKRFDSHTAHPPVSA